MTLTIDSLMTRSPHTVGLTVPLADAKRLMTEYGIRHLPVLDAGALVGLLSERDVQLAESLARFDVKSLVVEDAMSQAPYAVSPGTSLAEVAREMAQRKLGSAVVMEGAKVVGVFTTTDGMRALAALLELQPSK